MKSVVVGVDGSAGAADALRWAVDEARLHDAHLVAVHCWGGRENAEGDTEELARHEEAAAARLAEAVAAVAPDLDVDQRVVHARPEWGLLEAATEADLLVVGAVGATGLRGLLVGSVSQQVLHHAHVPVAVVRELARPTLPRRVVVGIDGSRAAHRALRWAADEASLRGIELDVIHAWSVPAMASSWAPVPQPGIVELERASHELVAETLADVDLGGLVPRVAVTHGPPGPVLVDASRGADLVVVGSRGLGGFKELLLGSVGQHVSHHATCPTVVLRPGEERHDH